MNNFLNCDTEVRDKVVEPSQSENNSNDGLYDSSKTMMIICCGLYILAGLSCGFYLGAIIAWYFGLIIGAFFTLPIAWSIPMTIHYNNLIKKNEPISKSFKICILIFVSRIAGIMLLTHKDTNKVKNEKGTEN